MSNCQYLVNNKSVAVMFVNPAESFMVPRLNEDGSENVQAKEILQIILNGYDVEKKLADLLLQEKISIEEKYAKNGFVVQNGIVRVENDELPYSLGNKLKKLAEENLDCKPLMNFWTKLKENPSFNSVQRLHCFLEANHFTIFEDGDFVGYKGLRGDYKDIHSGTFDNTPGNIVEVPRNKVDDNYANECSYGLHVAAFNYANGFAQGQLVKVKVNPKDVVSVPSDSNFQKIRCCRYEVLEDCKEEDKNHIVGGGTKIEEPEVNFDDDGDYDDYDDYYESYYDENYDDYDDEDEEDMDEDCDCSFCREVRGE